MAIFIAFALILILYVGSYLFASTRGEFKRVFTEANLRGGDEMKLVWMPNFFTSPQGWNPVILLPYMPLYVLDQTCWHRSDKAFNGAYPVDKVVVEKMKLL